MSYTQYYFHMSENATGIKIHVLLFLMHLIFKPQKAGVQRHPPPAQ